MLTCVLYFYFSEHFLCNNLYYVTLISIFVHTVFTISYKLNLYLATTCLMWPYFNVPMEGHIRQVIIYGNYTH